MTKEIKQLCDVCEACQELKPRNGPETLKVHGIGNAPWEKVGMDLFEIKGKKISNDQELIQSDPPYGYPTSPSASAMAQNI